MSCLYILIGPPACGKSTLAEKLAENMGMTVISSDAVRKELYGDESVQKDHAKVFAICHARTCQALQEGKDVVFDATNLVPKHRINLIDMATAEEYDCEMVAGFVYTGGVDICLERNRQRERKVPDGVIRNMYDTLKRFPPSFDEGFNVLIDMNSIANRFADISTS